MRSHPADCQQAAVSNGSLFTMKYFQFVLLIIDL
ncbi:hypothetical protein FHS19_001491 [Paenibacillus rhizosphaerae]|uniref:Uncharacterized protein n=1 Tax=Paenibacillus rhizosphaerae TaxID=297318 RepID=A0A839TQ12_9BACL|nr:hypothetical protein [Paenibacillus rhizosphaerae]